MIDDLTCEFCGKNLSEAGGSMHITFGHVFCNRRCEWRWRTKDDIKAGDRVRLKDNVRNSDRHWVARYQEDFLVSMVSPNGRFVCNEGYPPEIVPVEHVEIVERCSEDESKSLIVQFADSADQINIDIRVGWARNWERAKYGIGRIETRLPSGIELY